MSKNYGPHLPPGFKKDPDAGSCSEESEDGKTSDSETSISQSSSADHPRPSDTSSKSAGFCQSYCQDPDVSSTQLGESSSFVGPSLPTTFSRECDKFSSSEDSFPGPLPATASGLTNHDMEQVSSSASTQDSCSSYGTNLPPRVSEQKPSYGLTHPASSRELEQVSSSGSTQDSSQLYGPALPPNLLKSQSDQSCSSGTVDTRTSSQAPSFIGPIVPSTIKRKFQDDEDDDSLKSDSSDECIGPLPSEAIGSGDAPSVADDFERRAKKMKDKLTGKDEDERKPHREEWMTELPDNLGLKIGLGARTFRRQEPTSVADRSGWTDTPGDKNKDKKKPEDKHKNKSIDDARESKRNEELAQQLKKYNKQKRPESLLEMHKKKVKKEKKNKKSEPEKRRPFDHEVDMKLNLIDPKRAKTLIDKASLLNTRFGHGKAHFL